MAWRDGKASATRLLLFMASIILGIAAVVSIQSFSENLKENIGQQSKALMGADFIIDSRQLPNERVQGIIDSLGGSDASEVNFASMAAFPKNDDSKLVRVRGIEGQFPFYGTLDTEPISAAQEYQEKGGALVDATMMLQYDLKPGDSIKIGNLTIPILGSLKSVPGSSAISTSVAPPVLIPFRFIEKTGLLQVGSRKEYQYFFVAPETMDLDALNENLDPILDAENADLDTHKVTSQRLGRSYTNVSKFLNLVAFIALLLGCIGIASSVHIYIKEKLRAVAVLKCMGATRKQTFLIFLIQIAGMGFVGGLIGTLIGIGLQQTFPLIIQEFLPFNVEISFSISPIIMGLLLGVFMSVLFALLPLLNTWYVSPLEVLRIQEGSLIKSRRARFLTFGSVLLFIYLFSFWLLESGAYALGFVITVVVTFSILAGVAILFMKAIKRFFPKSWGFIARQSLLNLFRPNNQTMVLILAIGLGTFLISTLYFTKDMLQARTSIENGTKDPNIILMDVQTAQKEAIIPNITSKELPIIDDLPIVTMRMHSIKGVLSNTIRKDSTSRVRNWVLNNEFRATYRDSLVDSEVLSEGEWISEIELGKPTEISISSNLAQDTDVEVGDEIVFNIQGVLMNTIVGSIRTVDWGRAQMNFSIVFPKGVLENAPQFHVLTTYAPDEESSANLQRDLVKNFPNVSIIDLRQILSILEDVLDKISWVINFMAFFSILTGIIVLIGSVRTSKYQRIRESVLLRTLGANSKQILKINALEYFYLGILGSGIGVLLSLISSQLLASFVFEVNFVPSFIPFLVFLPGITALVLFIGLVNSKSVLTSPPLEVLRKEG
ncbi:ABC transporter permease [Winogradskyella immobilis]|uniref:ABC transporter permease n=1 Tax=Winogradskyella immobilis TaxID=2816852 RepID=A0ABS8EQK6_9FLAO|nr:FtsX-like permease family protein [Winogradskyella immobilis]MCC1485500.1 ABC transporter permease [Winogradskyella immobilis]MCG0017592.1 ABC transporter permease [Winogradskyella immobilis]